MQTDGGLFCIIIVTMRKTRQDIDQKLIEEIKRIPIGYSQFRIEFFFWLGVVSAILLRITNLVPTFWAKVAYYLGVIGYMLFFVHRLNVSNRRKNTVKHLDLLRKVENQEPLDAIDYNGLKYILWSLSVSKEKMNYLIIYIFSAIAIIISFIFDFVLI